MTPILLVRQTHEAKRAGKHDDWRVVIGDIAHSWATRKEPPVPGKPIILWEQPVHDAAYATTPHITIPDGQYGAGTQYLSYAQKGTAHIAEGEFHLELNNGDRFLIKKLDYSHYGDKAWLCIAKKRKDMTDTKNPYLEKVAAEKEKKKTSTLKNVGMGLASAQASFTVGSLAAQPLARSAMNQKGEAASAEHVKSYVRKNNLRHVNRYKGHFAESHYAPPGTNFNKRPTIVAADNDVALHEYGHAKSFGSRRKSKLGMASSRARFASAVSSKMGIGAVAGGLMGASDNEKVRKASPYVAAASVAPMMVEEARATLHPYKHLRQVAGKATANKFLRKMGPAYGSYAAVSAGVVGSAVMAKKWKERTLEKKAANNPIIVNQPTKKTPKKGPTDELSRVAQLLSEVKKRGKKKK